MRRLPPPALYRVPEAQLAGKLHANAEDKGAQNHRDSDRRHGADDAVTEGAPLGQDGREQHHRRRQHRQLGADPRDVLVDDGAAVGAGEPKGRMVKRDPHTKADDKEARLLGARFQQVDGKACGAGQGQRQQRALYGGKGRGRRSDTAGSPYFVASATILATMTSSSLPIASRAAT